MLVMCHLVTRVVHVAMVDDVKKILRPLAICIYCILMTNAMHLITVYNVCIIFILFCLQMISSLGVSKAVLDNVIFCHQEESNWWVLDYCYEQISVSY